MRFEGVERSFAGRRNPSQNNSKCGVPRHVCAAFQPMISETRQGVLASKGHGPRADESGCGSTKSRISSAFRLGSG